MKNTITINTQTDMYTCLDSCEKSNEIYLNVIVAAVKTPQLYIYVNGETQDNINLKANTENLVNITKYIPAGSGTVSVQFYNNTKIAGSTYTISFKEGRSGSLKLTGTSSTKFEASYFTPQTYEARLSSLETNVENLETQTTTLSKKVTNGALRINNHFSGITKQVEATSISSAIATITGTTSGEAILYAEATFPVGTYRKLIDIYKNGNRIARQEAAYTGTGNTNVLSVCTISTVSSGDKFTAKVYNGSSSQKSITNCVFRMVQLGLINQ